MKHWSFITTVAVSAATTGAITGSAQADELKSKGYNVLFIAIDDLNDWVGCLGGNPQAITPTSSR